MKMIEIMKQRFACRNYTDEKLSDELVRKIVTAACLTPSSLGLEPWQIYAVSGEQKLARLSEICLNQKQVAACSHALILATHVDLRSGDKFFKDFLATKDEASKAWYLGFIKDRFDAMSEEQIYAYGSNQCYALMANLINIAYEAGVKSCVVGGFDRAACDRFLGLKGNIKSVLVITLGKSNERAPAKKRRELSSMLEMIK